MDPYKRPKLELERVLTAEGPHGNRSRTYRKERRRRHWEARKARMRRRT